MSRAFARRDARRSAALDHQPAVARIARRTRHHRSGMRFGLIYSNNSDAGDDHEMVSGTVADQGTAGHSFTVTTTGSVSITLTAVGPLTTISMGVGIGTWNGTTCGVSVTKNDNARTGAAALAGTANAGSYCVNVYDSGNVPEGIGVS